MPCIYEPAPPEEREAPLRKDLDKLTRMLCSIMKQIEEESYVYDIKVSPELELWWKDHQKKDMERKEELTRQALAKLTPEEREALGFA